MIKYAKIIDEETKLCQVGIGEDIEYYESIGFEELDVKQSDIDNNWYISEFCPMKTEEEKQKEEQERIGNLKLTSADVERAIYEAKGMDFEDLIQFVINSEITGFDVKRLKIELKANHFVRKHPYINIIGKLLGYSPDDMNYLFENKKFPDKETHSDTQELNND